MGWHRVAIAVAASLLGAGAHAGDAASDRPLRYPAADLLPVAEGVTTIDLAGDGRPAAVVRYRQAEADVPGWRSEPILFLLGTGGAGDWLSLQRFAGLDRNGAPRLQGFSFVADACTETDLRLVRQPHGPPLVVVAERVFVGADGKHLESDNLDSPAPMFFSVYDLTPLADLAVPRGAGEAEDILVYQLVRKVRAAGLYCSLDEAFARELAAPGEAAKP